MSQSDAYEPKSNLTPVGMFVVTASTMLATLMQALDSTIANVALPYMQGSLAASQDEINWVLTSYIVSAAIMTAPTGFLAMRFGRTRLFVISIIGFTLASILCGLARSLDQIVIFRIVQGGFGAALVPLSQGVLFDIYPAERRGQAMALWGIGVQVGPVLGPILGGWLTGHYGWRWVFFINVPFGILAALGLVTSLKETQLNRYAKLDWIGFGSLSLAVGALQIMLDRGEQQDWFTSSEITIEAGLACVGFYLFTVQSSLAQKPFLSPKLIKDVNFVIGTAFIFITGLIMFSTLALLAPYLQTLMNYPVVTTGLVLAPRGIGSMVSMMISGQLVGRLGARPLMGFGFLIGSYVLYEMTQWTPDVSEQQIVINGFIQGISVGFIFVPMSTVVFSTLPFELRTEAAGIFSLMRNLGSAIGISVTGALLERSTQVNHEIIGAAVTPFNRGLQSGAVERYWNPTSVSGAALLDQEITRQASVIGYINDFKLMLVLSVLTLPLVLFIKSKPLKPA